MPIIIPCRGDNTVTHRHLYETVWRLVSRLLSPLPAHQEAATAPNAAAATTHVAHNHALDCDESLGSRYPFRLKCVRSCGMLCGRGCPWYDYCIGCHLPCNDELWQQNTIYIAIDWDPTALHLRYQLSAEKEIVNEAVEAPAKGVPSTGVENHHQQQASNLNLASKRRSKHMMTLNSCLYAFCKEEELGKDELYHCSKCKTMQLAKKKLDIWRLPPLLIIHLKRFQFVNNNWIKSQKVVNFPHVAFDPSNYMSQSDKDADCDSDTAATATMDTSGSSIVGNDKENDADDCVKNDSMTKQNEEAGCCADDKEDGDKIEDLPPDSMKTHQQVHGHKKVTPARKRQPSFREESPPMYDLYAMLCHTGVLAAGHYVAYAKNYHDGKWYCYNDSSCKEVPAESIDFDNAYTLFYQRQHLQVDEFMPNVEDRTPVDCSSIDEDYNSDLKKYCSIQ